MDHFRGGGPCLKKISGAKNLVKCRKKKSGLRPENKGGPKIEKKVVFWHTKCEKFRIRHPNIFFSKNIQPTNAAEKALCTKRHFSNGNHSKNKNPKKSQNFQNFAKLFFKKKKVEKKIEKNIYFFLGACGASASFFFSGACGAFFFQ